jgi:hypothetical protein
MSLYAELDAIAKQNQVIPVNAALYEIKEQARIAATKGKRFLVYVTEGKGINQQGIDEIANKIRNDGLTVKFYLSPKAEFHISWPESEESE